VRVLREKTQGKKAAEREGRGRGRKRGRGLKTLASQGPRSSSKTTGGYEASVKGRTTQREGKNDYRASGEASYNTKRLKYC